MVWYKKSAEQDYAVAQYSLALMYDLGNKIPQNYSQALIWYTKAAELNDANAQNNLAAMYGNAKEFPEIIKSTFLVYKISRARRQHCTI